MNFLNISFCTLFMALSTTVSAYRAQSMGKGLHIYNALEWSEIGKTHPFLQKAAFLQTNEFCLKFFQNDHIFGKLLKSTQF